MADLDGVPTMVVENLEVNNNFSKNYLHNMENKIKYREFVFDYIRKFSKYMNPDKYNPVPTYFSSMHYKIKDIDEGLEDSSPFIAEPLGQITDGTYINSYGSKYFSSDEKLKLHLINIS